MGWPGAEPGPDWPWTFVGLDGPEPRLRVGAGLKLLKAVEPGMDVASLGAGIFVPPGPTSHREGLERFGGACCSDAGIDEDGAAAPAVDPLTELLLDALGAGWLGAVP
jgi:hypothetical protein